MNVVWSCPGFDPASSAHQTSCLFAWGLCPVLPSSLLGSKTMGNKAASLGPVPE